MPQIRIVPILIIINNVIINMNNWGFQLQLNEKLAYANITSNLNGFISKCTKE